MKCTVGHVSSMCNTEVGGEEAERGFKNSLECDVMESGLSLEIVLRRRIPYLVCFRKHFEDMMDILERGRDYKMTSLSVAVITQAGDKKGLY